MGQITKLIVDHTQQRNDLGRHERVFKVSSRGKPVTYWQGLGSEARFITSTIVSVSSDSATLDNGDTISPHDVIARQ